MIKMALRHSRMANSFLWHGSVEQKQHILTKNDTYKICRSCFGLSKNSKRGGSAIWAPRNIGSDLEKVENFGFPTLEVWKWKGVQKGGQPFRMLVPIKYIIIWSSDESFRGHISIFWHNHYGISDIAICPPFAPPFSIFLFLKKVELHILPESKINLIRRLVPKIRYFKVKNVVF